MAAINMVAVDTTADSLGEVSVQLNRALEKTADLLEHISRLSDELRRKDSMLATLNSRPTTLLLYTEQ